jgi:hypothetical protein
VAWNEEHLEATEREIASVYRTWLAPVVARKEEKARALLIMWRAWHMRNDMIFGAGKESVVGSAKFLESYDENITSIRGTGNQHVSDKGKKKGRRWSVQRSDQGQSS